MWNLFKLTSFSWLLISTYCWVTAPYNQGPFLVVINLLMIMSLSMMPIKIRLDAHTGRVLAAIVLFALWYIWIDGAIMGLVNFLMFLPILYLLQLPYEYKKELLQFSTKWYAILLIPALLMYWMSFFTSVPSIGTFVQQDYPPFINHVFYIETTFDDMFISRFNAFFLEPGHQALLSTFLMIANRFRFKECKWLWVLLLAVIFSFSLAGYLLAAIGYTLLRVNTILKAIIVGVLGMLVLGFVSNWAGGENAMNEMIVRRLEQDDKKGIKGNNRFTSNTDFTYSKTVKNGEMWTGVQYKTNMNLIEGAGFKIFIIKYGLIGVILSLILYLTILPSKPDYRYTISFLIVLALCFLQRSYPTWYSWIFPYVIGIYVAKGDKERQAALD